jgi:hypothetical protein
MMPFSQLSVDLKGPEELFLGLDVVLFLSHTDPGISVDDVAVPDASTAS